VFKSILCPVDFSEHSEVALGYALELAAVCDAHLTILTVIDSLLEAASTASGRGATLDAQTQQELHAMLTRMSTGRRQPHEPPGISVVVGEPAEEILKQVVECQADLIVMGTQGLEGAKRLMFGSTTERVLRESRIPVLAVPAGGVPRRR
jgi:nucleotide-binding universal stress UspA family protein